MFRCPTSRTFALRRSPHTATDLVRSPTGSRELPALSACSNPARAASSARALRGVAAARARLDSAVPASSRVRCPSKLRALADELRLIRSGTPPERIASSLPVARDVAGRSRPCWGSSTSPTRSSRSCGFGEPSRPRASRVPFSTPWVRRVRRSCFAYLRSPYQGLRAPRSTTEWLCVARDPHASPIEERPRILREAPVPVLADLRSREYPVAASGAFFARCLLSAYEPMRPGRRDVAPRPACLRACVAASRRFRLACLHARRSDRRALALRGSLASFGRAGRVAVLDLLRERTRRFDFFFVLGLRRGFAPAPLPHLAVSLDDDRGGRSGASSAAESGSAATATSSTGLHARHKAVLYLVREAGPTTVSRASSSPFLEDVPRRGVRRRRHACHITPRVSRR